MIKLGTQTTKSLQKKSKKIVLIGGPGTGKSTVLNELKNNGYYCFDEVSREITQKAQKDGIDQLFLEDPLLFSKLLLEGREQQYLQSENKDEEFIFFDRGIPDVHAYLDFFKSSYPQIFLEKSMKYRYYLVFHFSPWKQIHETDNERYENFQETVLIDQFLLKTYKKLQYKIINVPFGSVPERVKFIINALKLY